ncbi:MAG: sulfite exporter TauE/SafE family protein [Rhodospirillales bacterium]|nr:sulfite exporter TauE/SafE family protein [Rhodospirillales bacterium]
MIVLLLLFAAAFGGGALNALAGGGTFLTFPALVFAGVPPIMANATSAIATMPGYVASVAATHRDAGPVGAASVPQLSLVALIGGIAGAVLLLVTPSRVFSFVVPWVLLAATLLFAAGPSLLRRQRGGTAAGLGTVAATILAISTYGGYFNGGLGILLLAALGLLGLADIHRMNALKNLLSAVLSVVSVATFAAAGIVVWRDALLMAAAAALGGYCGAHWGRRVPQRALRLTIVAIGAVLTALFFRRL